MFKAHPYEEVAYDIYPLENKGEVLGLGRIGEIRRNDFRQNLQKNVKKALDVPAVRVVGDLKARSKKSCCSWRRWK